MSLSFLAWLCMVCTSHAWHILCPQRDKWALYADFTPKICPFYAKNLPILHSCNVWKYPTGVRSRMPAKFIIIINSIILENFLFMIIFDINIKIFYHYNQSLWLKANFANKNSRRSYFSKGARNSVVFLSYLSSQSRWSWPLPPRSSGGCWSNPARHWSHVSVRGQRVSDGLRWARPIRSAKKATIDRRAATCHYLDLHSVGKSAKVSCIGSQDLECLHLSKSLKLWLRKWDCAFQMWEVMQNPMTLITD